MVGPEPTGASALTMAPTVFTPTDNSTEHQGPVSKNDVFGDIKNKFLNEMDKLPRKWWTTGGFRQIIIVQTWFRIFFKLQLYLSQSFICVEYCVEFVYYVTCIVLFFSK